MKRTTPYLQFSGYAISLIFLYLTFRKANLPLIIENMRSFNGFALVGAFLLNICFLVVRGLYQRNNLMYVVPNLRLSTSIISIGVALFYNVILPARIGEVIRTFFLSKQTDARKASILSYIFIEKLLDFLVIVSMLVALIGFQFIHIDVMHVLIGAVGVAVLIPGGIYLFVRFHRAWLARLKPFLPQALYERFRQMTDDISEGFRFYRSVRQIGQGMLLLLVGWVLMLGIFFLLSYSYLDILTLPWYSCLFFLVFSALSLSLPSAPAGLGVMHYGLFFAVHALNPQSIELQVNVVAAFVIVMHFCIMLLDLCVGGITLLYSSLFLHQKSLLTDARLSGSHDSSISND